MRRIIIGIQADRDLNEAWEYIAADNVAAADRLCDQVERAISMLAEMPGIGHERADVRNRRWRFWSVRPYVIGYRYTSRTITIVRILHGARDFRWIFE